MPTEELYNLHLGKSPPRGFEKVQIGPFCVELVPEYSARLAALPAHATKTVSYRFADPEDADSQVVDPRTTNFKPAQRGAWEVTAMVTSSEVDPPETSLLTRNPIPDGGLWDLCTLLTFVTGRRVATGQQLDRFDPNSYGPPACIAIESLHAAALAWTHRKAIVEKNLVYALQMHNEALGFSMLQITSALNNAALNVLVDRWAKRPSSSRQKLATLKNVVCSAVDGCEDLAADERAAFKALLGSKIDQGLGSSLTDRTRALLVDLGIIDKDPNDSVNRRIKFMNMIRNALTHSGQPPLLKGLTAEQSMRYTLAIVTGVVPDISITAIGRILGFTPSGLGSLKGRLRVA